MERLRGLNFGGWLSQIDAIVEKDPEGFSGIDAHMESFIGREDFLRQKGWGFNHIRLPIDALHFFTENEEPIEKRLKVLDRAVSWAQETGLSLILDLHECPGHDFADATKVPIQQLFLDDAYLRKTEKIWASLTERYSGRPHVMYEVLNEPVAPDAATWNRIKDALCSVVRKHAPKNPIVVGSNMWNWPATFKDLTPLEMDNVVYAFHFYEPLLFTHQFAPWMANPELTEQRTYPSDYGKGFILKYDFVQSAGKWDRDRLALEIRPVVDFAKKYGAGAICDEFGVFAPVPMDLQVLWLKDLLSVLKDYGIGYSYWNYKNLDFGVISSGERMHEKLPQYSNPEKTNMAVLEALRQG